MKKKIYNNLHETRQQKRRPRSISERMSLQVERKRLEKFTEVKKKYTTISLDQDDSWKRKKFQRTPLSSPRVVCRSLIGAHGRAKTLTAPLIYKLVFQRVDFPDRIIQRVGCPEIGLYRAWIIHIQDSPKLLLSRDKVIQTLDYPDMIILAVVYPETGLYSPWIIQRQDYPETGYSKSGLSRDRIIQTLDYPKIRYSRKWVIHRQDYTENM